MYKIPISLKRGIIIEYAGAQVTFSAIRFNKYLDAPNGAWVFDMSWRQGGINRRLDGIVITSGINLLAQYKAPLPNLYVVSSNNRVEDIISIADMNLYIRN